MTKTNRKLHEILHETSVLDWAIPYKNMPLIYPTHETLDYTYISITGTYNSKVTTFDY